MPGHFSRLSSVGVYVVSLLPKRIIYLIYNIFKNTGGYIGLGIRYACIKNIASVCGTNVAIFPNVIIKNIERLSLGDNVSIHSFCYIDASGTITIGNNVSIAHGCSLISFTHTWNDLTQPIKYNPCVSKPIDIQDDVWIGCGARIIGECSISSRNVIGAGSVIKGKTEPKSLYAGVPAELIKKI